MTERGEVWEALAAWRAERRRFVLATVIESRGFTPRKPGTHMLVDERGATAGTIGGGAIEAEVLTEAARVLASGTPAVMRRHLTQELGMCCGGEMSVFLEVLEAAPRLLVLGGGYIAQPLAAIAATAGFDVTVVDARPEWARAERFPHATVACRDPEHALPALAIRPSDFVVVVTHDHALDQRLVQELLRGPARFVGMVGSLAKQRKFALRLRARGFTDAEIARLRTPLGLDIAATTPEEIAVSIVAELVAARRGVAPARGWTPPARPASATEDSRPMRHELEASPDTEVNTP
jgi:xanthine dehydrogenase accessory factor